MATQTPPLELIGHRVSTPTQSAPVGRTYELIAERYERKSLAITANMPFSMWGDVFVDPAMTLAAVDCLVHHSTILEMNVESYRRRAAQAMATPARKVVSVRPSHLAVTSLI